MTRKEINLKEIYSRRKILGERAVKNGLCKTCFKRPIYIGKSKTKCYHCYSVIKKCNTEWVKRNPEKAHSYSKISYYRHRDKNIKKQRDYRKTDIYKEKYKEYKERTSEYQRERNRRWVAENRDKYRQKARVATELRRFRKRNNGNCSSRFSTKDWNRVLNIFGNRCLKCGSTQNIQIDHVIPLSLGGEHSFSNIQPLCAICNNKKQNRVADYRTVFFSDWT